RRWRWVAAAAITIGAIAAVGLWKSRQAQAVSASRVVLLPDVSNATGDDVFDGALRQAIAVKLEESPFLNVFPDARMRETLRFMNRPPETRITADIGRELCQRQQLKAMLASEIAAIGQNYAVTLHATNCQSGATLAREQVEVAGEGEILGAGGGA